MKKIIYLMGCMFLTHVSWSQDLYVGSEGVVRITSTAFVYANAEVSIAEGGDVTIDSNASNSASFLAPNTSTAIGDITYKRYIANDDWHLVSAPVADQNIGSFLGVSGNEVDNNGSNGNKAVAYYNNTNVAGKRWTYHNTTVATSEENKEDLTSINFTAGQGYSMKKPTTDGGTYTFTGTMANADVSVTIPTTSGSAHLWSAIGNPFPSFLTVSEILADNPNKLDGAFAFIYVWDATLDGGTYTPAETALQLAPGQAFMVKAKTDGETFIFKKTLQNYNSGATTFYKNSTTTPTISVHLTNGTLNKSANLEFLDSSTAGLDVGYDAGAYQDGTPSFSINTHLVSDSQGIDFIRQSLPTSSLDSEVAIPLSINAGINEVVTFSIDINNLPDGVSVYLEDTLNNTFTNLTEAPLELKTTSALSGIGRFYLRTTSGSVLSTEDSLVGSLVNVYKTSNGTVKITGLTLDSAATFSLFNILGKEVLATKFIAQNVQEILVPANLPTGVYIVNVVSDLGTFHKKIVIE